MKGVELEESQSGRMLLGSAYPIAMAIEQYLCLKGKCTLVNVAGSLRRMQETIGDIDIIVGGDDPIPIIEAFTSYPGSSVITKGTTQSSIRLLDGTRVDMRVVKENSYGAALQYFTGSKDHNIALRRLAIEKGFKLNEYGAFRKSDGERVAGETEEGMYRILGLDIMPPEMRENRGEIEASAEHRLPDLVSLSDIKGRSSCSYEHERRDQYHA